MPKNENNENLEATQAPAEFTPEAPQAQAAEAVNVTPIETARKRKLGAGAIVGISAAGVALLAGVFGGGMAVANVIGHDGDRGPAAGMNGHELGEMAQGGQMPGGQIGDMDGDGDGPRGHHGPKGQMPGGQMQGDTDGPMSGDMPHEHDENGQDIVPNGTATTTPGATTN